MKTILLPMVMFGMALVGNGYADEQTKPKLPRDTQRKTQADFVFDLHRAVVKDRPNENLTISPYGARLALDMVRAGAAGETKVEIDRILGKTKPVASNVLPLDSLTAGSPLTIAAALWTQTGHPILPEFLKTIREEHGATVEQVDFFRNPEEAVRRINAWSEEKTNRKINFL